MPHRWFSGAAWSKVARRLIEHQDGVLYRFRTDALPLHGMRTLAALPIGAAVWDTLDITVPRQAAAGRYALKLALVAEPFVENLRLRDILRDDDLYNGVVLDSLVVQ